MRLQAVLANGAVQQALMLAKGEGGAQLQARLMPVTVDINPLNNPWISYAIYLASVLMPAFVFMFAMFTAVYSIVQEIKDNTTEEWLKESNNSVAVALAGKLLPQTLIFLVVGLLYLSVLYGYMHFPLNMRVFSHVFEYGFACSCSAGICAFCFRYNPLWKDSSERLCFMGGIVVFCQWIYLSCDFYALACSVGLSFVSIETLLSAVCRPGFEWCCYDIFLAILSGFGNVCGVAFADFAEIESGFEKESLFALKDRCKS